MVHAKLARRGRIGRPIMAPSQRMERVRRVHMVIGV